MRDEWFQDVHILISLILAPLAFNLKPRISVADIKLKK